MVKTLNWMDQPNSTSRANRECNRLLFFVFVLYFSVQKVFQGKADNLHEIPSLIFSEKNTKNKKFMMSSAIILLRALRDNMVLTLILLSPDMYCFYKQCRSRSVGF